MNSKVKILNKEIISCNKCIRLKDFRENKLEQFKKTYIN